MVCGLSSGRGEPLGGGFLPFLPFAFCLYLNAVKERPPHTSPHTVIPWEARESMPFLPFCLSIFAFYASPRLKAWIPRLHGE